MSQLPAVTNKRNECITKAAAIVLLGLALASCAGPDPRQELQIVSSETYWVIDMSLGQTHYLAPAVRLTVRNKGKRTLRVADAKASFRRKGEENVAWGSGWTRLKPAGKRLAPGETVTVVLKSDGRYYSQGSPEQMLRHELFRDAVVHVYFHVDGSAWIKMLETDVERRIGSHSVEPFLSASPVVGLPSPPR